MILENLKPMTDEECQAVNGGFIQFLMGAKLEALNFTKRCWK